MDNNTKLIKIPTHIAFIIDGNGRWAKQKNKPRSYGHKVGVETVKKIVKQCKNIGIKTVSIFAFSTENWNRPQAEVNYLFKLFIQNAKQILKKKDFNGVRYHLMGDISKLPEELVKVANEIMEKTKNNSDFVVNIGINYGGRDEIARAVNKCISNGIKNVTIEDIKNNLDTSFLDEPQLVVRTGGEQRISNFMLFQMAYSELYFTKTYWPDFDEEQLYKALEDFQSRERRFGSIKKEKK